MCLRLNVYVYLLCKYFAYSIGGAALPASTRDQHIVALWSACSHEPQNC